MAFSTNTVFSPDKADKIYNSVKFLFSEGVKNIGIGIDQSTYWNNKSLKILKDELSKTKDFVLEVYLSTGKIISDLFSIEEPSGINMCSAGGKRITLSPDGGLSGCSAFYFYDWNYCIEDKNNYYYGNVNDMNKEDFENKFNEINSNHMKFKTDNFKTEKNKCFLCEYLQECMLCPAIKYSFIKKGRSLFQIPEHVCQINKITNDVNRELRKELLRARNN